MRHGELQPHETACTDLWAGQAQGGWFEKIKNGRLCEGVCAYLKHTHTHKHTHRASKLPS